MPKCVCTCGGIIQVTHTNVFLTQCHMRSRPRPKTGQKKLLSVDKKFSKIATLVGPLESVRNHASEFHSVFGFQLSSTASIIIKNKTNCVFGHFELTTRVYYFARLFGYILRLTPNSILFA